MVLSDIALRACRCFPDTIDPQQKNLSDARRSVAYSTKIILVILLALGAYFGCWIRDSTHGSVGLFFFRRRELSR